MKVEPRTLKGFRDFLPAEARKRQYVIDKLKSVFESYGFEPLETPALEFADILKGKYGEEEKLIYELETKGGDRVALRYDQTVPLARVMAQYQDLPKPFKRYQIQPVWRGENTQKGRYREFVQCDADIVGMESFVADAEILALVLDIYAALGLDVTIKINDRTNFENLDKKIVGSIDKLEKIGESEVLAEMVDKGMSSDEAKQALFTLQAKPITQNLQNIIDALKWMGKDTSKVKYEPTLARGLDYYTGIIFETIAEGSAGSLCSGGRWDKMIGTFIGQDMPAVGFGLGFDRTIEVLKEKGLIPEVTKTKVLVTVFSMELGQQAIDAAKTLRESGINTELYLDDAKMDKQLKYADQKGILYAIIIGPKEAAENSATIKNMKTGEQKTVKLDDLPNAIK